MVKGKDRFRFYALQLCAVFGFVYLVQVTTGFDPGYNASTSPIYKFFTSFLGHSDLQHLLNNVFFIGLFGSIYERLTSGRLFLSTFLASALTANLTAFVFFPETAIIGASGGGMGLMAALAVYRPRKIGLALGVPAPMWLVLGIYVLTNVAGLNSATGVAYEAHLLGLVAGSIIGLQLRKEPYLEPEEEEEEFDDWRRRIRRWEEKWMLDQSER